MYRRESCLWPVFVSYDQHFPVIDVGQWVWSRSLPVERLGVVVFYFYLCLFVFDSFLCRVLIYLCLTLFWGFCYVHLARRVATLNFNVGFGFQFTFWAVLVEAGWLLVLV